MIARVVNHWIKKVPEKEFKYDFVRSNEYCHYFRECKEQNILPNSMHFPFGSAQQINEALFHGLDNSKTYNWKHGCLNFIVMFLGLPTLSHSYFFTIPIKPSMLKEVCALWNSFWFNKCFHGLLVCELWIKYIYMYASRNTFSP